MPSETNTLTRVVLKHPRDAFRSEDHIAREWEDLNFSGPPDLARAIDEYDRFAELVASRGAAIDWLPVDDTVGLDSIYTRDASIVTPRGPVLCSMGKRQREPEPAAQGRALKRWGLAIVGVIQPPGRVEGGDLLWLADRIVAVGRGYRTNDSGIAQLRAILAGVVDEVITVPLPHWKGVGDVFHLMSLISPIDRDLAVVYSPLLPVPFRERLIDLGYEFVEVPHEEFDSMGANVLALAPRVCIAVDGNPVTRAALERAGADVLVYRGTEISLKGGGGPTCLTRPLTRAGEG
jgi:N-dimethylarginine dimethylaminohydrolase